MRRSGRQRNISIQGDHAQPRSAYRPAGASKFTRGALLEERQELLGGGFGARSFGEGTEGQLVEGRPVVPLSDGLLHLAQLGQQAFRLDKPIIRLQAVAKVLGINAQAMQARGIFRDGLAQLQEAPSHLGGKTDGSGDVGRNLSRCDKLRQLSLQPRLHPPRALPQSFQMGGALGTQAASEWRTQPTDMPGAKERIGEQRQVHIHIADAAGFFAQRAQGACHFGRATEKPGVVSGARHLQLRLQPAHAGAQAVNLIYPRAARQVAQQPQQPPAPLGRIRRVHPGGACARSRQGICGR